MQTIPWTDLIGAGSAQRRFCGAGVSCWPIGEESWVRQLQLLVGVLRTWCAAPSRTKRAAVKNIARAGSHVHGERHDGGLQALRRTVLHRSFSYRVVTQAPESWRNGERIVTILSSGVP